MEEIKSSFHNKGYNPLSPSEIRITRILNELTQLTTNPPEGVMVMYDDNLSTWKVYLTGPDNTDYEGLVYEIDIWLPSEYPFVPPHISFKTGIFHPNIPETGLFMLLSNTNWSTALTMYKVFLSIQGILSNPDIETNVYNDEAAQLYRNDRERYRDEVLKHYN